MISSVLLEELPVAIAILDKELCYSLYSNQWQNDFNIPDDLQGKSFFTPFYDHSDKLYSALTTCQKNKNIISHQEMLRLKDGSYKYFKYKIKPWGNETGNVVITMEDITEEKRQVDLLKKAKHVGRVGGWEYDLIKNKLYWTEVTKEIHEVPEDYIPNLETGINFYKEGPHRNKIRTLVNLGVTKGKSWDTELIIVSAKGNEIWVRAKGEVEFIDKKAVRIVGTFQDINEKKIVQLEHQKISERLMVATQTANIGVWEYQLESNTVVWDKNMYKLYGISENSFSGVYEAWENCIHPDDKERGQKELELAISGERNFNTEFRVIWPNGEVKNIKAIAKTITDNNGKAVKLIGVNWDITELKRTSLKLEKNEESFLDTFENSAIGMALLSLNGKWIKVNNGFCNSIGYSQNELLNLTTADITHPDDLKMDEIFYRELRLKRKENYEREKRYIHKNGSIVHVILTVTVVKDIDNQVSHFIAQILDITKRIKANRKLEQTIERLNVATKVANLGIWDLDISKNTLDCNANMYSIWGVDKNSSNFLHEWMDKIHPDDLSYVQQELTKTIEDKVSLNIKFRGLKPNGDIFYLFGFGEAMVDLHGKTTNIIGANLDISELRNKELLLEKSNESFSNTFENSVIGMAILDLDYTCVKVNKSLSKILGYTPQELTSLKIEDITHPDDLKKSLEIFNATRTGQQDSCKIEKRLFNKKGDLVHVILVVTLVRNIDGKPSHTIAQILDLTERIEAEKKLKVLVEVTKGQNESLMNFAHIVSHNLRSHSTNLNMLTEFLSKEKDVTEILHLNNMINEAAKSLTETIGHLNEVVQLQTGAMENLQSVSIVNVITQITKSIKGLLNEQNAIINLNVAKSHFVNVVPAYFESIILNLITNALKYRDHQRDPIIDIATKTNNARVEIKFSDNGQGIDLNRHGDKIFGMYKTFHKHKDAKGIGLFITKNQIEAMNGKITVESEVNKGTTFIIELRQG